ncbi:DNA-binding transcriptional regulator, AcrR family [Bosea sp. CRIB-10]|nr:DNA-binding transcriptional regulator, AcrR family [Bosea sp. CRIB-10]
MSISGMDAEKVKIPRGRGRPRLDGQNDAGVVNREVVVDLAYDQAKQQSLGDISFVGLAKELGVAPGALHYHLGTKDDLISAILNRFYKELLARLAKLPAGSDWRDRIGNFATALRDAYGAHRGAAEHILMHAKFRVFQKVREGETDYGALYLDKVFSMFREAGFDATQTAQFYHALALHCLTAAGSEASRLAPVEHEAFLLKKADSYPNGTMPGLKYALRQFAHVNAKETFRIGLEALLDRFAVERAKA